MGSCRGGQNSSIQRPWNEQLCLATYRI